MSRKMTVADLIELLSALDQNMPVVVRGYEDGYHDVGGVTPIDVVRDVNTKGYFGPHDDGEGELHAYLWPGDER